MTLSLYLGIAVAAFIAPIVIRKRWSSGPATDTRSDAIMAECECLACGNWWTRLRKVTFE